MCCSLSGPVRGPHQSQELMQNASTEELALVAERRLSSETFYPQKVATISQKSSKTKHTIDFALVRWYPLTELHFQ